MPSRFHIDRSSPRPVYVQLQDQIQLLIHRGVLSQGDPMPTVRALAVELGVNANTVTRVYRDLQAQGVLRLERGVGTFVDEPKEAQTLTTREYQSISKRVEELVTLCQRSGLTSRELIQLVGSTWKESQSDSKGRK